MADGPMDQLIEDEAREPGKPRMGARRAALLGLRLVAGTIAVVAAAATIAAVGLVPSRRGVSRPST